LLRQRESLETIRTSYHQMCELLRYAIDNKESDNQIANVLSTIVLKMKYKYIEIVLEKYKIDQKMYISTELKEEVEELLGEKD
jgi:hypothetical protein